MNQQDITFFLEAVKCGNMAEVSRKMFISRQAVSKRINQLEQELGCKLFLRNNGGLSPTKAGQLYYELFTEYTQRYQDLRLSLGSHKLPTNTLALIGFPETMNITNLIKSVRDTVFPDGNGNLGTIAADPDSLFDMLDKGDLDIIISPFDQRLKDRKAYGYERIGACDMFFIAHRDYMSRIPADTAAFTQQPLVLIDWSIEQQRRNGLKLSKTIFDRNLMSIWESMGGNQELIIAASNPAALEYDLCLEKGISLVMGVDHLCRHKDLCIYPAPASMELYCIWKREGRTAHAQHLSRVCQEFWPQQLNAMDFS